MDEKNKPAVIGTFSGMCADAGITNENGLDITRPVWEAVFNSELYKQAMEIGHLIGYLGHPDDPNCMNFQDACIIMREGHIEDDDKVYGTFDLIDTPVGRIVKTFIDAGVQFGISVRGAGDIIDNSVDPETFVFRGFDLVTFPAYREAIPEFKAIAASTDVEQRQKYQKVCAAVQKDLPNIMSCEALDVIQEQLPEQSDIYDEVENRKSELLEVVEEPEEKTLEEEKIDSLTDLYLEEKQRADKAEADLLTHEAVFESEKIKANRKLHVMTRLVAAQERDVKELEEVLASENTSLTNQNKTVVAANKHLKERLERVQSRYDNLKEDHQKVLASTETLKKQLHVEKENNLQYHTKIEASEKALAEKDSIIRDLKNELDETVVAAQKADSRTSNLDAEIEDLQQKVLASQKLIEEYQDAYATLYARAVGGNLQNVSVTASTNVAELQKKISGSSSQVSVIEASVEPQQVFDVDYDFDDETDLVTM